MIRVYTTESINRLFLSPYVQIWHRNDGNENILVLGSRIYQTTVSMPLSSADDINNMFDVLSLDGMSEYDLKESLKNIYPELKDPMSVIHMLMKTGIIE